MRLLCALVVTMLAGGCFGGHTAEPTIPYSYKAPPPPPDNQQAKKVSMPVSGAEPQAAVDEPRSMAVYRGKHYRLYTDLPRTTADRLLDHMEIAHKAYATRVPGRVSDTEEAAKILVFSRYGDYLVYLKDHGRDGRNTGGLFVGDAVACWAQNQSVEQVEASLRHEGFHQFAFSRMGDNLPLWVNEGLAEYFAAGRVEGAELRLGAVTPQRVERLHEILKNEGGPNLFSELLNMTVEEWAVIVREDRDRAGRLYVLAWSVVQYLCHADGGKYAGSLDKYMLGLARGNSRERSFDDAFGGATEEQLAEKWRTFWDRQIASAPRPPSP